MYGDAPVTVSVSIFTVALDVLPGVTPKPQNPRGVVHLINYTLLIMFGKSERTKAVLRFRSQPVRTQSADLPDSQKAKQSLFSQTVFANQRLARVLYFASQGLKLETPEDNFSI